MIQYPMVFSTEGQLQSQDPLWRTSSSGFEVAVAVPPEFEGPGGALSPEDLYNQALTNCFLATFRVYAQHSKLEFESVWASGQLTVDKDESNKPVMKDFALDIRIRKPSNPEKAKFLVGKAFTSGFILNSVKTNRTFNLIIEES